MLLLWWCESLGRAVLRRQEVASSAFDTCLLIVSWWSRGADGEESTDQRL